MATSSTAEKNTEVADLAINLALADLHGVVIEKLVREVKPILEARMHGTGSQPVWMRPNDAMGYMRDQMGSDIEMMRKVLADAVDQIVEDIA